MKHAIAHLQICRDNARTNHAIRSTAGDPAQAELDAEVARDCEEALTVLSTSSRKDLLPIDGHSFVVPLDVLRADLTLSQMGCLILVIAMAKALPRVDEDQVLATHYESIEFNEALAELRDLGVLAAGDSTDTKSIVSINLAVVTPDWETRPTL